MVSIASHAWFNQEPRQNVRCAAPQQLSETARTLSIVKIHKIIRVQPSYLSI